MSEQSRAEKLVNYECCKSAESVWIWHKKKNTCAQIICKRAVWVFTHLLCYFSWTVLTGKCEALNWKASSVYLEYWAVCFMSFRLSCLHSAVGGSDRTGSHLHQTVSVW